MRKSILTIITVFAMCLFIDDVKAITCDYQLKIGDQEITFSTTEKLKKENCNANNCEIAHDYKFKYDGKTTSNGSPTINIGGKKYTLEFKEFSLPKQFKNDAIRYMNDTSRTCQKLYADIDKNGTKYTVGTSGKNQLTTITKPQDKTILYSCIYKYYSNGKTMPYPITLVTKSDGGTYMTVNGKEIYYGHSNSIDFTAGGTSYKYGFSQSGVQLDKLNGCKKITGTLTEKDGKYSFIISNGSSGNKDIYVKNPKNPNDGSNDDSNGGSGFGDYDTSAGDLEEPDCGTILDSEAQEWLQKIFTLIKIVGPILVIVLGMMDFVSAVMSSEDGAMKKAWGKFVKRVIAAIALILLPIILEVILDLANVTGNGTCGIE